MEAFTENLDDTIERPDFGNMMEKLRVKTNVPTNTQFMSTARAVQMACSSYRGGGG